MKNSESILIAPEVVDYTALLVSFQSIYGLTKTEADLYTFLTTPSVDRERFIANRTMVSVSNNVAKKTIV